MPVLSIKLANSYEEEIKKSINILLKDTQEQCVQIEDLLEQAPEVLRAYYNFREILRQIKRGDSFGNAISEHALSCCPPNKFATLECDDMKCTDCWRKYCLDYLEAINGIAEE